MTLMWLNSAPNVLEKESPILTHQQTAEPAVTGAGGDYSSISDVGEPLPLDVAEMLAGLHGISPRLADRRLFPRVRYVARGSILSKCGLRADYWTHDLNRYTAGFIAPCAIGVGISGVTLIELPGGERLAASARVMRCREFLPGCFEGYVNFTATIAEEQMRLVARGRRF